MEGFQAGTETHRDRQQVNVPGYGPTLLVGHFDVVEADAFPVPEIVQSWGASAS